MESTIQNGVCPISKMPKSFLVRKVRLKSMDMPSPPEVTAAHIKEETLETGNYMDAMNLMEIDIVKNGWKSIRLLMTLF